MNKRAQLSLFLLIGIVTFVVVVLVMHLKSLGPKPVPIGKIQNGPIQQYVVDCADLTLKHAIINLGVQGGFVGIPDYYSGIKVETLQIPNTAEPVVYIYDYYDYPGDHKILGSISDWQDELSNYVNNNLQTCLNDFQPFRVQGYKISAGKIKSKVVIQHNSVFLTLYYPMNVSKSGSMMKFSTFKTKVNVPLWQVHEQAQDILDAIERSDSEGDKEPSRSFCKQRKELGKFCPQQSIDFLFKINKYLDYQFEFLDKPTPTTLWLIKTKFSDGTPYYFIFAAAHKKLSIQVS